MRATRMASLILLACAMPARGHAQAVDTEGGPTQFKVGALQIIHQRRTSSQTVSVELFLLGGARQIDSRTAGIEPLVLRSAASGSRRYPIGVSSYALTSTGSSVRIESEDDWTIYSLRTIASELDSAWMVYADQVVHPLFREIDILDARRRMLAEVISASTSPDHLLQQVARPIAFARHPYANDPSGTDASLRALSAQAVRDYYASQFMASRMLLVVVGNVDRATIERLVHASFADLPAGNYTWTLPPPVPPRPTSMTIIPRTLGTDYIIGIYPGPLANSRDYGGFRLGTSLLGARLNYEIRELAQISYAAYAPLYDNMATAGAMYASTTKPEQVMRVMLQQMEEVAGKGIPLAYMPRFVSQFEIQDLTGREANAGQATALARAFLVFGDVTAVSAPFRSLRGVSEDNLRIVTARYIPSVQFIFMGDTSRFRQYMR